MSVWPTSSSTPPEHASHQPSSPATFEHLLKSAGMRVTRPRVAVLEAVQASPHADTSEILAGVRSQHAAISHQAVYDCLAALTTAGLLRRIQPMGSAARYELQVGNNHHHHAVCRQCGSITDVECASRSALCLVPETPAESFRIDEAEVLYWGFCSPCQTSTSREDA